MKRKMITFLLSILLLGQYQLSYTWAEKRPLPSRIETMYKNVTVKINSLKANLNELADNPQQNKKEEMKRIQEMNIIAAKMNTYQLQEARIKEDLIKNIRAGKYNLNKYDETALHVAAKLNYYYLVKVLLENGANPTKKDKSGMNVLHAAAKKGAKNSAEVLTNFVKSLLNTKDKKGNTPLHYASTASGQIPIVKAILSCNVDLDIKDKQNKTALDIAKKAKRKDIAREIEKARRKK